MDAAYKKYMSLPIDGSLLSLEKDDLTYMYFCYPVNAIPIGFEGCILYCFIPEYGDMVFASNPETCVDDNVYPLAKDFSDFVRLILACGSANPIEQIVWMTKEKFQQHIADEKQIRTQEQQDTLNLLSEVLGLTPMENPYEYVKELQRNFDGSKIQFSDEYYDVKGNDRDF